MLLHANLVYLNFANEFPTKLPTMETLFARLIEPRETI